MSTINELLLAAMVITLVAGACMAYFDNGYCFAALCTGCLAVSVFGLMALVIMGGRGAGATSCRNWGKQAGYRTKMVVTFWADSGTCLAQAPNGHWVSKDQIIQFIQGAK